MTLQKYADLFGCQIGHFPMKYLGVTVSYSSLRNYDWEYIAIRYLKCCDSWIGNSTSSGGRLTLLNSSLSSIAYYYMSMFLLSKTFIERLDKYRRKFFWCGGRGKKRYYLVKWTRVCRSKNKGGLGVKDLHK